MVEDRGNVYIIAEAGVNHNGSLETAKEMIRQARECGADAVKFQTFRSRALLSRHASKAEYQKMNMGTNESQLEMLEKLEMPFYYFEELKRFCQTCGIDFLSTAFDPESIVFLDGLGMECWKVPSGEVTNLPYLIKIAGTQKPVIMSTGMCRMDEIQSAIQILKDNGSSEITLLHCNTEYPTPYVDVNLLAMLTMRAAFHLPVGYSDHTLGIEVPIAAVALGATIIEKHFTLDRNMEGPDHKASLEPQEFKRMVKSIRNIEDALGDGVKQPSVSESKNIDVARKSIVAKKKILKGEIFTEDNLAVKRPGYGISPMQWFNVLGLRAVRDFDEDELIEL